MEDKVLELLNQVLEGYKKLEVDQRNLIEELNETNIRLDRIETKISYVYEQTTDLAEFKREMKQSLSGLKEEIKDIKGDLTFVDLITANNYSNIVKLKAIK